MDSRTIDDDGFEGLHPRARTLMRLWALIGFGVPPTVAASVAALVLSSQIDIARGLLVALVALPVLAFGLLFGWRYAGLRYLRTRYRLDADGLSIRRGVYWHSETRVARSRVQHTDVNRGPLDRRLGLATLKVHTAGTRLATIELDGLDAQRAVELRDALAVDDAAV